MRKILHTLSTAALLVTFGQASAQTSSYLTETEAQAVVSELDSICGDSWCSGDLNYGFDRLICNDSECYLDLRAITRNDNGANQSRAYRCELNGFQSPADLLLVENNFDGSKRLTYTSKLYDAVSACINEKIPAQYPVAYVPKASACRDSLRGQPRFTSAAHSVYAEIFYELDNKVQASARVLNQMVEQYASKDSSCSLQYHMVFEDEVSCERVGGINVICSVPTDLGRYLVIKDYVDGAAVIYIEGHQKTASLGTLKTDNVSVKLANPEGCYTELLNLDGKQKPQEPFNSSDHHSYFVSAKHLNAKQDARSNAAQLVNRAVSSVEKSAGSCKTQTVTANFNKSACQTLGGIQTCVLAPANAGYYVVTKDAADGAFVTFIRFD
jgi:hypothetical protein